jgi:rhodanese-related sulfurtransferase
MYRILLLFIKIMLFDFSAFGQGSPANRLGHCQNPDFDREVAAWLHFTVPAIDVDSLRAVQNEVLILDAREPEEYAVSHLPGAKNCGFKKFDPKWLDGISKNQPIVVYCSIGYRSEKIARKVRRMGFTRVSNLYGSIFEWTNRGYPLVDMAEKPTSRLHTFNRNWGRWVTATKCEKVD